MNRVELGTVTKREHAIACALISVLDLLFRVGGGVGGAAVAAAAACTLLSNIISIAQMTD